MRDWLKEIRLEQCLNSCKETADKLDISYSHYVSIENGTRNPSTELAKKIGKLLSFDWTRFYE